jgi:ribosomal-protein-alanine N-acetyltransferase
VESDPTTTLSVRPLVPDDAEALGDLLVHLGADPDARHFHPHPMTREEAGLLAGGFPGRRDEYFGAFVDGHLAGYGMLRGWDEGFDIPSFGVAVDAEARGRGLGRALLRYAIRRARDRGARTLMLKVHTANPGARDLYLSEGFVFADTPDDTGQLRGTLTL